MKSRMLLFTGAAAGLLFVGAGALALQDEATAPGGDAPEVAEVGKKAPNFELKDLKGKVHKLSDHKDKIIILEWFNPECPFVVHIHQEDHPYKKWSNEMHEREDVVIFAINSGAPGEQGTGLEKNRGYQERWNIKYPILIDEEGKTGRAYDARRTPHMYLIDKEGVLRYKGAIDNAPSGRVTGGDERVSFIKRAFRQLTSGETVSPDTTREYGCTVKYVDHRERGREPARERPQRDRGERPRRGGGQGGD